MYFLLLFMRLSCSKVGKEHSNLEFVFKMVNSVACSYFALPRQKILIFSTLMFSSKFSVTI